MLNGQNKLLIKGDTIITGSLHQSGTFYPDQIDWFSSSIGYNTGSYILTTTANGLTTYAGYGDVANTLAPYIPTVSSSVSALYAETASYAPAYLPLTGGTINGNVTVNGTASIAFLNVTYESASVIYSSGSNQFGDASNDTQTLWGTVDIKSGPVLVTGSVIANSFTGSLLGTASYATQALSASYAQTASYVQNSQTASYVENAQTASYVTLAQTASYVQTAQTASYVLQAVSASFATLAQTANTASYVVTAQTASYVLQAVSASFATTASYATQALSASWAPGGSSTPTFPYTGSAIISGSLEITGSLFVQYFGKTNIDSSTRQLYDAGPVMPFGAPSVVSVDWASRTLNDRFANTSIDWGQRITYDSSTIQSIDWDSRQLSSPTGTIALNWANDTILTSNVYQNNIKSSAIQDAVSTNYNIPNSSYIGDVIEADGISTTIGITVTDGMLVNLDSSTWTPVSQANSRATRLLGIAYNVYAPGGTGYILLEGHVVIDDTSILGPHVTSASYGLPIYIEDSTTTGTMSTVVPTTTGGPNIVRLLGHCYQQNGGTSTQWMMKFRPSNDWVEI